jgi:D-ribose pyranose/furanose isomerase RbsD
MLYSDVFKNLLYELNSEYKIPCFETLKKHLDIYLMQTTNSLKELVSIRFKDFQVHSRILRCEEVKNVHVDHMVIVQHLKMLFERLCLDKEKVVKMTTDAGGNVRKA